MGQFEVIVGAGSLRSDDAGAAHFPHRWTAGGVTVESDFTGAHLLHLAVAGCVLNDVYREATAFGVPVDGVRVTATGDYDTQTWASTGIEYTVDVRSEVGSEKVAQLLERVDTVAEIPQAIRRGAPVHRTKADRA